VNLGSHSHFIVAAYMAVLLIIGALIAWIFLDYWALKRTLSALEESGVTRRSTKTRMDDHD
jgi:heme exporter protein CcmD